MISIHVRLPEDRQAEGRGYVAEVVKGVTRWMLDFRCRGEADNTGAAQHGNPSEDPTRPYGDHPYGTYRVTAVEWNKGPSYGPCFLRLDPIAGEALKAEENLRAGLGGHGGELLEDGRLRPTYGCNRWDDAVARMLGALVEAELKAGRTVTYECRPLA